MSDYLLKRRKEYNGEVMGMILRGWRGDGGKMVSHKFHPRFRKPTEVWVLYEKWINRPKWDKNATFLGEKGGGVKGQKKYD